MDFSIFVSYTRLDPPENYTVPLYQEKLAQAIEGDRLGFRCIWIPEHHMIHKIQVPNGLLACAHVGQNVKCRVGQMVNLLTYRHPLVTAGEIGAADQILGGRLSVGVGRGAYQYEFDRLEIPFSESKERFHEALDILERIWQSDDEGIEFAGKYYRFDRTYVWPRPLQKPHPELWYAAMTMPSIQHASRKGYHVANWPFLHPMSVVAKVADEFHSGRAAAGNPKGQQRLAILRGAFVAETEAKARACIEPALTNHRINQRLHYYMQNADRRGYVYPDPVQNEPDAQGIYDNLVVGTPAQCLEKVREYDRLGVDELILWFDFMPHESALDAMRLFAEEVLTPYTRQHQSKAIRA